MTKELDLKISEYLRYRKLNHFFLALLGWSKSSSAIRSLRYIYLIMCSSMIWFVFNYTKAYRNNVLLLTRSLASMTGFIIVTLKMLCLLRYRKEFYKLFESVDGHIMNLLQKKNLTQFILHEISRYKSLTWNITFCIILVDIVYNVLPIMAIVKNYIYHIQPTRYIFVYPTIFPWPVPYTGFIYQLHFIYESLASWAIVFVSFTTDSIFNFFIFGIVCQLREISYDITHIDERSDYNVVVKKCITQYCSILECRNSLQKMYGPIILCLMIANAVVLCTLIYQIDQMKSLSIIQALLFALYIYLKVIQTYMYAWCGTHLTSESEAFREAIYAANWYGNKRIMTAIVIMQQQKPLVLTACNFSILSLDIFTKILNTSISYFFLLKTIE